MGLISKIAGHISLILDHIARWLYVALMLLIVSNVILRLFGSPILATIELAEYITAMAVGLSVGYCGAIGGHIAVEFITDKFNKKVQDFLGILMDLIVFIFVGLSFWRLIIYANDAKLSGLVSMTSKIPSYLFIYVLAFGFLAYCLVALGSLIDRVKKIGLKVKSLPSEKGVAK